MNEKDQVVQETIDGPVSTKESKNKPNVWLIIMTIILFLILVIVTFQFIDGRIKSSERAETIETARLLAASNDRVISSLLSNYEDDVYNNPNVSNINHQLLISQEYAIIALQTIAEENSIIIDLLLSAP